LISNITNIDSLVRAYIIRTIQPKFPDLDITENSPFDDLFVKPMIELLLPVFEKLNTSEMMRNLDNADYLSEDDLDRIGEGNYGIVRKSGNKASTILTLSFASIWEGETIVIPAGILFENADGFQFQTTERKVFSGTESIAYYDSEKMTYDLPVFAEAVDVGEEYNVDAETITKNLILFNSNLLSVTNKVAVTNGKGKESNKEYADRIREFYLSRQLGTQYGYENFIKENFDEVLSVYVSGYRDQYMERDKITVLNPSTLEPYEKHIGGMVDIYLQGALYVQSQATISLKSNLFRLTVSADKIVEGTISVINHTDATKTPAIATNEIVDGHNQIVLVNDTEQSFSNEGSSEIYFVYDYKETPEADTQQKTDIFIVGEYPVAELDSPVTSILSIEYDGSVIPDFETHYELITTGEAGTSDERTSIRIIGLDSYVNGTSVEVFYNTNSTIQTLSTIFNKDAYRVITADILVRKAESVPINVAMQVKLQEGFSLDAVKKAKIRSAVSDFFAGKRLGNSTEESDIVTYLKNLSDLNIEYIKLPLEAFYVPEDISSPISYTRDGTIITVEKIEYPVLNKFEVSEVV